MAHQSAVVGSFDTDEGAREIVSTHVGQLADTQEFFAPANTDAISALLASYKHDLEQIEKVAAFMQGAEMSEAATYFFEGARSNNRYVPDVRDVFTVDKAIPALNARYWQRALHQTDVMDFMPNTRRREWNSLISDMKTPDFTDDTVRATLTSLLAQRMDFLAEMVDGLFQGLSGEHVTNRPEGFSKRMIIDWCYDSFGSPNHKADLIHDLRCVIAKFMGRDVPYYHSTRRGLSHFRESTGKWHSLDGGAMRVRVYLKGTAHLEVHPEIAYRLNQVLAHRHPFAIPDRHRKRPAAPRKEYPLMQRPIPFAILQVINDGRCDPPKEKGGPYTLWFSVSSSKQLPQEVRDVLAAIGGVEEKGVFFLFDYDPRSVINDLLVSGTLPDHKSHQFYQSQGRLADDVIEMADIGDEDTVLEPQAGQGGLADRLPKERTVCVEISRVHCNILRAKGHNVVQADFLEWAETYKKIFSRVVMNPPFSEGRALAHLKAAASLVAAGGRLVAVLPASFHGKALLPGFTLRWSDVYANAFVGTEVNVVVLIADKN